MSLICDAEGIAVPLGEAVLTMAAEFEPEELEPVSEPVLVSDADAEPVESLPPHAAIAKHRAASAALRAKLDGRIGDSR